MKTRDIKINKTFFCLDWFLIEIYDEIQKKEKKSNKYTEDDEKEKKSEQVKFEIFKSI
jgi:hypothetical protein